MPRIRVRVVCTLWVTIETFAPTMRFSSVDLPAFGSPISATSPQRVAAAHASPSSRASSASAARLLRRALRGRPALRRAAVLEPRLDREHRRMVRPLAVEVDVVRRPQAAGLRPFLQRGLGVAA